MRADLTNQKTTFETLFSKPQLEKEIALHYHTAIDALQRFAEKVDSLIGFSQQLQNRSHLSMITIQQ